MARSFLSRLSRGTPLALSCAAHLLALGGALAVAARLVPRLDAVIHADLVAPETPPAKPPDAPPRAPRRETSRTRSPLTLPRLVEAPVSIPDQTAGVEPPAAVPEPARPAPPVEATTTPPSAEPAFSLPSNPERASPGRPAAGRDERPPAVSIVPVTEPAARDASSAIAGGASAAATSPGSASRGTAATAALGRAADAAGTGPGPGRGTEGSTSTASLGTDIARSAIPRGGYQVHPRYPASARRSGIQGTTVLRVFVARDGRVTDVGIEKTAGHPDLDEAAADAVRRWRFDPARRGEEAVGMWVLLPVEFRLR